MIKEINPSASHANPWLNIKKEKKIKKRSYKLTTKLVLPIWQSPNKLIFKETKSESLLNPRQLAASNDVSTPASMASGGGEHDL
jgi:hypothetical protein